MDLFQELFPLRWLFRAGKYCHGLYHILVWDANGTEPAGALPLLEGKRLVQGSPAAYVCQDFTCEMPVTTAEALETMLAK